MNFIDRLDELRKDKGITKKKLLEDCNFGKNQYQYWEKNKTLPTQAVLKVIAEYFGVSVDYLMGNTDIKEKPTTIGRISEPYIVWGTVFVQTKRHSLS